MKYFYDTEFLEGTQKKWFGNSKPTIDLISIGIISEDNREYYAISKDFNLKEAWNRYELKHEQASGDMRNIFPEGRKVYWIRENVLKPIFKELLNPIMDSKDNNFRVFNYKNLKTLVNKYGKSNKQIATEIKMFIGTKETVENYEEVKHLLNPKFYGYYSAYDHVALCWMFGKMINLPSGFPMYTIDLKQEMDNIVNNLLERENKRQDFLNQKHYTFEEGLSLFKTRKNYPKQSNEHNALADAKWNKELYEFLNNISLNEK